MSPQSPELTVYEENYFNQPMIERETYHEKQRKLNHEDDYINVFDNNTPKRDSHQVNQKENMTRTRKKIFDPLDIKDKPDDALDPFKMENSYSSRMIESNRANFKVYDQPVRMSSNSSAEEFHKD